jgi:hypothetical protein
MKNKFVADGQSRLLRGRKNQAAKLIEKKYADELSKAGSVEKLKIRARMAVEYLQRANAVDGCKPSPGTLW